MPPTCTQPPDVRRVHDLPECCADVEGPWRCRAHRLHGVEHRNEKRRNRPSVPLPLPVRGPSKPDTGAVAGRPSSSNSGSRTPKGTKRWSIRSPGMPTTSVERKNVDHPIALTANPVIGPATTRGRANRLEKSAYWVAENRFSVRRSSSTEKAPVPMPDASNSNPVAAYRAGADWARRGSTGSSSRDLKRVAGSRKSTTSGPARRASLPNCRIWRRRTS